MIKTYFFLCLHFFIHKVNTAKARGQITNKKCYDDLCRHQALSQGNTTLLWLLSKVLRPVFHCSRCRYASVVSSLTWRPINASINIQLRDPKTFPSARESLGKKIMTRKRWQRSPSSILSFDLNKKKKRKKNVKRDEGQGEGEGSRDESSSSLGKSSSRFASRSVVQGPGKAEPQLRSLRSVLGRHCCSGGLTWRGVAAQSAPAPLCARSRWALRSRVCPPGRPPAPPQSCNSTCLSAVDLWEAVAHPGGSDPDPARSR